MKGKSFFTALLVFFALNVAFAQSDKSAGWNFIFFEPQDTLRRVVSPLTTGSSLRFEGDSVIFSGSERKVFSWDEVSELTFSRDCLSPLSVRVTADSLSLQPVPGMYALLSGDELDYMGVLEQTGADGVATFANVPYGHYSLFLFDREGTFTETSYVNFSHVYDDMVGVRVGEVVELPEEVNYEATLHDDGLYSLELTWLMGSGLQYGPYRDYLFIITLDGEYAGETSETNFTLDGLDPGTYAVGISSVSWYGNPSDGSVVTEVELLDQTTTGVSAIGAENGEVRYYDLNGRPAGTEAAALAPGVYVRLNGSQATKVLIER